MDSHILSDETFQLVHDSYRRCMFQNHFLSMFHEKLIESSHEIKQYFAKLPRHQHYRILAKSIAELVSFAEEKPEAIQKMNDVARVLGRRKLNIAPELYTYYSLAVMETLSLLDHRWSPQIEAAWEKTLSRGINHLIDKSVIKF